jgi:hypothetical protein
MGTTLTGTTPQDTYDSLIKVTDNGPLSGSLKTLTDGLGNDSALALSTTAASITGSLTTTAKTLAERVQVGTAATLNDATGVGNTLQFANYSPSVFVTASADSYIYKNSNAFGGLTSQSLVFQTRSDTTGGGFAFVAGGTPAVVATITSAGNVGIGTSEPAGNLHIASAADTGIRIQAGASSLSYIDLADTASGTPAGSIAYNHITNAIVFNGGGTNTEFARIDSSGNVGIGTNAPVYKFEVSDGTRTAVVNPNSAIDGVFIGVTQAKPLAFGTSDTERMRITGTGALLVGTTTAPTVNTGTVAVIGSSIIHSGTLNFPSPYSGSVQIDIVYSNWGSNNVIGLVDVMVGLRQYGATGGTAFGKVFATNSGASAGFNTFNTTDVTTSQCSITAASGGNYTLRITIDPSNNTDLGSYYLNIPTSGGVTVSSISVTFV